MCVKRRFLAIFLVLSMLLGPTGISASAAEFSDMPDEGDWSYAALDAAVKNSLLKGIDGKILPGAAVSRAQFAAILSRAFGATAQADISGYTDVAKSDWYYADMARAVGMKALAGSGELLRPEELITRQETFVALARALKLAPGSASVLDAYTDGAQVAPWAVEGVAALAGGKYIEGANGMLNPQGTITRAELAQVLYKLIPAYVSTAGTYSEAVTGNLMVNAPGVTLKGITVPGDLILGDGIATGDATLDGVTVSGRTVIRGGGVNSIVVKGSSKLGEVVIDNPAGPVALKVQDKAVVGGITVCSAGVALTGIPKGTIVTVEKTATGATLEGKTLTAGESVTAQPSTPPTGGGNSGGPVAAARTVKTWTEFMSALNASDCNAIIVDGSFGVYFDGIDLKKPLTINADKTLTVEGGLGLQNTTLTNKGTLVIQGYMALGAEKDGTGATLDNAGTITVNGDFELFAGSTLKAVGTIDGEGVVTLTDLYTTDTPRLWGEVSGIEALNHAAVVNSEARLRTAMESEAPEYGSFYLGLSADVVLAEDLTIPANRVLVVNYGARLTIPAGKSLVIEQDGFFRIEGDVVVEGTATNHGEYYLASIGTLTGTIGGDGTHTANYTVKNQADWNRAVADIENCTYINVNAGANTIDVAAEEIVLPQLVLTSGTLSIPVGATVTANGYWELLSGAALTNAGTLTPGDMGINGTLNNSGTLNIGEGANVELHGATLANTGDGTITREGRFWMENSSFTSTTELELSGVEVSDLFEGQNKPSTIPDGVVLEYYDARIGDQAGLVKFQTAELPVDEVGSRLVNNIAITSSMILERNLEIKGEWDHNGIITGYTLTVAPGATLTINPNTELSVGDYGTLDVRGAVSCKGRLSSNCWEDENNESMVEQPGQILNNGAITIEEKFENDEEPQKNYYPQLSLNGEEFGRGLLVNRGTLTNKRDMNINGGELDFQSGSITNGQDAYFGIRQGGVLDVADGLKIVNHGNMDAIDVYDGVGVLVFAPIVVPDGVFYVNDTATNEEGNLYETSFYTYGAEVWSGADIAAAIEADYAFLRVQGEFTWENGTLPQGVRLQIDNYWDDEEQCEKVTTLTLGGTAAIHGELIVGGSSKLVIAVNADVTVSKGEISDGPDAHMQNDGSVENSGSITVTGEGAHLGGDGEYVGEGSVTGEDVSDGWKPQEP